MEKVASRMKNMKKMKWAKAKPPSFLASFSLHTLLSHCLPPFGFSHAFTIYQLCKTNLSLRGIRHRVRL